MFALRLTVTARRQYDELQAAALKAAETRTEKGAQKPSRQEGLFKQVKKTLVLLANDPRRPGLQTHQYYSLENPFDPNAKVFEACAQQHTPGAYRVFWCHGREKNEITVLAITPHP